MPEIRVIDAMAEAITDASKPTIKSVGKHYAAPSGRGAIKMQAAAQPRTLAAAFVPVVQKTSGDTYSAPEDAHGPGAYVPDAPGYSNTKKKVVIPVAAGAAGIALSLAAGLALPISAAIGAGAAVGGYFLGNRK